MGTISKMLLIFFSFIFLLDECSGQNNLKNEREKDIKLVIGIYEKNVAPYLDKFGKMQAKPLQQDASDAERLLYTSEVKTSVTVHKANFVKFGKMLLKDLLEKEILDYTIEDRGKLIDSMELYYKTEFLYLDYEFFLQCKNESEKAFTIKKPG